MKHAEDPVADGAKPPIVFTPTEARQGVAPNVARRALTFGVALTVLAFPLIYFFAR
ncbi:hypothetical protein [Methylocapsa acidiphila]|uniref:hypothetical protein n=1 Tax=Methylocapsa acidiphila TaxID=133552 RepID=UPI0018DE011D|nr:hypothetical protein [Methylocapsa acidiphila]